LVLCLNGVPPIFPFSFFFQHPILWRQDCGARSGSLTSAGNKFPARFRWMSLDERAPPFFVISFRARGGNPIFGHVWGHIGVCRQSRTQLQQPHHIRLPQRRAVYGSIGLLSRGLARHHGQLSRELWSV
jgi:hypothetical protein